VLTEFAHARRIGRHGRQVLISHSGRFVWVPAELVRPRANDIDDQQPAYCPVRLSGTEGIWRGTEMTHRRRSLSPLERRSRALTCRTTWRSVYRNRPAGTMRARRAAPQLLEATTIGQPPTGLYGSLG
jgi:hypothetical protein